VTWSRGKPSVVAAAPGNDTGPTGDLLRNGSPGPMRCHACGHVWEIPGGADGCGAELWLTRGDSGAGVCPQVLPAIPTREPAAAGDRCPAFHPPRQAFCPKNTHGSGRPGHSEETYEEY
jgi:hypothetical protein